MIKRNNNRYKVYNWAKTHNNKVKIHQNPKRNSKAKKHKTKKSFDIAIKSTIIEIFNFYEDYYL